VKWCRCGASDRAAELERELARLRAENARLLRLLEMLPQQARPPEATQTGLFLDRPGPVTASSSAGDKIRFFRTLFAARRDAYATRWENARLSPREVDRLAARVGPVRVGAAVDRLTPRPRHAPGHTPRRWCA
jgi:hypothetical protein